MKPTRAVTALVVSLAILAMVVPATVGMAGPSKIACNAGYALNAETSPTPSASTSPTIRFVPRTINAKARGRWIEAKLRMPLGTSAADIDTSTVMITDIGGVATTLTPVRMRVSADTTIAPSFLCMKFSRTALVALLGKGKNVLTVSWSMKDASSFSASDTVRVIGKKHRGHGGHSAGLSRGGKHRGGRGRH